ncbi:hypothetical protein LTR62_000799 [Meristemomyces frigidus]|uniref:TPR-like protein n=1 Tax=Meristemomyces frigidus TaxID=1508187 RepID=A0AAN7YIA0_9PEZI|nr:hypothetical protein LTR62_000799 [Meristemomyces frigidus]
MAELVALGVAANILQLVGIGYQVVTRVKEFHDLLPKGEDPEPYRTVRLELPLLLDILKRTQEQADSGQLSNETQHSLLPVVLGCQQQIRELDDLLDSLPSAKDTTWKRGVKAVVSVKNEKRFRKVVDGLKGYIQLLTYHQTATFTMSGLQIPLSLTTEEPVPPVFLVPFDRDEHFIDRPDLLSEIDTKIKAQRRVALAGIGGVGKSQIAIEYCYRFKASNPDAHVFWVHAATVPRLHQGYKNIAKQLLLPGWDDLNVDTLQLLQEYLSDSYHGSWLLVLDNADDISMFYTPVKKDTASEQQLPYRDVAKYLPRSTSGQIVVTTRDKRLGERLADRQKPILIEAMTTTEAGELLRSRVGDDDLQNSAVDDLLHTLGHIPLAITQAAAFINENDISVADYLTAIAEGESSVKEMLEMDLGDHRRHSESESSILATWKLSFDQISKEQPLAAEMLSLMAVMDLHSVPKDLLVTPSSSFTKTAQALGVLKAFSLVSALKGEEGFEMHRLVQLSVRHWLEMQGTIEGFNMRALNTVSKKFPFGDFENWKTCEQLLPHAHTILEYNTASKEARLEHAQLLHNMARFYDALAKYSLAHKLWQEALDIRKELLGNKSPDTLRTACYYGETLFREMDYKLGEEIMTFALEGAEEVLGLSDDLTRMSIGTLAEMNTAQGRFDAAEALYHRALAGKEQDLGTNMTDLKNADNLGAVLRRKKQYEQAEIWIRRSLVGRERSVGEKHPQTIRAANHLGLILRCMGRYDEAEVLNRRALEGFEETLGREHHMTLQSLDNLSVVFRCQGKNDQAAAQATRAYEGLLRLMGPKHRHTLQAQMSLALALQAGGKLEQAEELAVRALASEEETLGSEHPQIQVTAPLVESILRQAGKDAEADEVRERLIKEQQ